MKKVKNGEKVKMDCHDLTSSNLAMTQKGYTMKNKIILASVVLLIALAQAENNATSEVNLDLNSSVASDSNATNLNSRTNTASTLNSSTAQIQAVSIPSRTIITQKAFTQESATNAYEALQHTSGVFTRDATGSDPMARVYVRGLDKVGLYIDGISVKDFYMGENDTRFLSLYGFESVELYKGFLPSDFKGLGGAINLTSHKPQSEFELSFGARNVYNNSGIGGSAETQRQIYTGTKKGDIYFTASFFDTQRAALGFSKAYENNIESQSRSQTNGKFENRVFKVDLGYTPKDDEYSLHYLNQKGIRGDLVKDNTMIGELVFSATTSAALTDNPGQAGLDANVGNEHSVYDKQLIYFLGKSYFTPNFSLNSKAYYLKREQKIEQVALLASRNLYPKSDMQDFTGQSLGANLALQYDFNEVSNFKFGLRGTRNQQKNSTGNIAGWKSTGTILDIVEWQSTAFAEFTGKFGDFGLIFNASYDRNDLTKANVLKVTKNIFGSTPNPNYYDKPVYDYEFFTDERHSAGRKFSFGNFSLQALTSYDLSKAQSLYASVAKKNEMPNLYERYFAYNTGITWGTGLPNGGTRATTINYIALASNPNLRPESIISYEFGYNANFATTHLNLAAFYNDFIDMIGVDTANLSLTNENKGYTYGGEVSVMQALGETLTLGANYAFIQGWSKGTDEAGGHKFIYYPNHSANAKLIFTPAKALEFIGLGSYQSAPKVPTANGYVSGREYISFDILAKFTLQESFAKGLSISAGIYNVADRDNFALDYTATAASVTNKLFDYHFAGRRYFVGFDYTYSK